MYALFVCVAASDVFGSVSGAVEESGEGASADVGRAGKIRVEYVIGGRDAEAKEQVEKAGDLASGRAGGRGTPGWRARLERVWGGRDGRRGGGRSGGG